MSFSFAFFHLRYFKFDLVCEYRREGFSGPGQVEVIQVVVESRGGEDKHRWTPWQDSDIISSETREILFLVNFIIFLLVLKRKSIEEDSAISVLQTNIEIELQFVSFYL